MTANTKHLVNLNKDHYLSSNKYKDEKLTDCYKVNPYSIKTQY